MLKTRTYRRIAVVCLSWVVFQLVWFVFQIGGEKLTTAVSDIAAIPSSFFAAAACVWAALPEKGRARRSWLALGAACASWGIGEIIWTYYEVVAGDEVPFPGWADAGFLGLIPFAILAILWLPTAPKRGTTKMRTLLDGCVITGSILFIGWATVLPRALKDASGDILFRTISLAYPFSDLLVIPLVIFVLARSRTRERFALGMVAGGLLSIAFADVGFVYLNLHELYSTGSLIDPLWDLGFVLIGLAAIRRPKFSEALTEERRVGPAAIASPLVPFVAATCVAVIVMVTRAGFDPVLFWIAISVIACLTVRQVLALADNLSLNDDLERRVATRTTELAHALEKIEESSRLQDEFVANATHELFTPLTAIMAALETMSFPEDELPLHVARCVEIARSASFRMKREVEKVLLASGVAATIECARGPFDVAEPIRAAIDDVAVRGRHLRVHVQPETIALGDPEWLRMVVMHLVDNANKFAPAGEIVVDARTEDNGVHIVVSDVGPGIPLALRDDVFRRFYQVDGSSTRRHGGVGLGLFLARHLAGSMHGTLQIDDTSRGASFRLVLPAAGPDREAAGLVTSDQRPERLATDSLS